MINSIFCNPFDDWLIEELRKRYSIESQDVQAVIWFPVAPFDKYTCAIRFCKRIIIEDFSANDLVEKLSCVGNYLNLILNNERLVNKVIDVINSTGDRYGFTLKCADIKIAIEHTSLTPSYPINLSTFRSTAIGNVLMHYYKKFGAAVDVHYLVADTARNIGLVLDSSSEMNIQNYSGKPDHICGALFCFALERIGKFSNTEYIPKMFPKFQINNDCEVKHQFYDVRSYCKFCLDGHIETLSNAGVNIDFFDYESEISKNSGVQGVSYLANNVAYYSMLASNYDCAYSVVSSRQKEVISESLQSLEEGNVAKVIPIYFNDIVCKVDDGLSADNELAPDSIRSAVFHSVDSYIETVCLKFNISMVKAYNALKLMVLSHNPASIIVIDYNNYEDIGSFIRLLDKIEIMGQKSDLNNYISLKDVELAKNLILAYQIFSMNSRKLIAGTKELITANIVKYIKSLTDSICDDTKNEGLIKCTQQTVQNAMELLGLIA